MQTTVTADGAPGAGRVAELSGADLRAALRRRRLRGSHLYLCGACRAPLRVVAGGAPPAICPSCGADDACGEPAPWRLVA